MENRKCSNCGNEKNLVKHHKVPTVYNGKDDKKNLEVLCRSCHIKLHHKNDIRLHSFDFGTLKIFRIFLKNPQPTPFPVIFQEILKDDVKMSREGLR